MDMQKRAEREREESERTEERREQPYLIALGVPLCTIHRELLRLNRRDKHAAGAVRIHRQQVEERRESAAVSEGVWGDTVVVQVNGGRRLRQRVPYCNAQRS